MKRLNAIRYRIFLVVGFLVAFPRVALEWVLLHLWPASVSKGLRVVDPFPETRVEFVAVTNEALTLIEANDNMRFRRLQREVKSLLNMPLPSSAGAEYCRYLMNCRIDLGYFPLAEYRETTIRLLACRLVHESTHGYLCSKRVRQRKHRVRVEMLCYKEEARFARKLGLDLGPDWGFIKDELKPPPPTERRRLAAARR